VYVPIWLLILLAGAFIWSLSRRGGGSQERPRTVESIEEYVDAKKGHLYELEHFDSPHFVDVCDAFDAMEMNYIRLKQRVAHELGTPLQVAKDWAAYVNALDDLKQARVLLDVDYSDDAWDKACESMNAPSIVKDEIEKKFKGLLGSDWIAPPPDYFARVEAAKKDAATIARGWKALYADSRHLDRLEELREAEKRASTEESRG